MAVEFEGPFESWRVVVDGWEVPLLQAHPQAGGKVLVTLDHRYGLEVDVAEADGVVGFMAQCIAVASGFACHPSSPDLEPQPLSPMRPRRLLRLDATEEPEALPT